jgi:hypothetical protein
MLERFSPDCKGTAVLAARATALRAILVLTSVALPLVGTRFRFHNREPWLGVGRSGGLS